MTGFTIAGCQVAQGFRPLPARPAFDVYVPVVEGLGPLVMDLWNTTYDDGPEGASARDNSLRSVDVSTADATGRAWVAVATFAVTAAGTEGRSGVGPTSLIDAVVAAEVRLLSMRPDLRAPLTEDGGDLHGHGWSVWTLHAEGRETRARIRRFPDAWIVAAEVEHVYVGVSASRVSAEHVSLAVRRVVELE